MALRELFSTSQREALEAVPVDRAGLIEHYVLSDRDLSLIRRRRGAQNRLGLASQLALLRYPGRALLPNETPPAERRGRIPASEVATRDSRILDSATEVF